MSKPRSSPGPRDDHNKQGRKPAMPRTATTDPSVDARVRDTVRMLMGREGVQNREIARLLGLSDQSVSARLAKHWTQPDKAQPPFRLDEIMRLAEFFQVDVDLFLMPTEITVIRGRGPANGRPNNARNSDIVRTGGTSRTRAA